MLPVALRPKLSTLTSRHCFYFPEWHEHLTQHPEPAPSGRSVVFKHDYLVIPGFLASNAISLIPLEITHNCPPIQNLKVAKSFLQPNFLTSPCSPKTQLNSLARFLSPSLSYPHPVPVQGARSSSPLGSCLCCSLGWRCLMASQLLTPSWGYRCLSWTFLLLLGCIEGRWQFLGKK